MEKGRGSISRHDGSRPPQHPNGTTHHHRMHSHSGGDLAVGATKAEADADRRKVTTAETVFILGNQFQLVESPTHAESEQLKKMHAPK